MILLTAIFVMVVLGLVAAVLTESLTGQYAGSNLAQLTRQAVYAAASGVEWGRDRALRGGVCANAQIPIAEFTVTVACSSVTVTEGPVSYQIFDIDAESRHGSYGDRDFARSSASGQYSNL